MDFDPKRSCYTTDPGKELVRGAPQINGSPPHFSHLSLRLSFDFSGLEDSIFLDLPYLDSGSWFDENLYFDDPFVH